MERKNYKLKILYLYKILYQYSDEEHPLSTKELCEKLMEWGIEGERKSIYRDISVLKEFGADIISTRIPKSGFFLARRRFELPEVRLLLDAVLTAPFITNKKTTRLTGKLRELLSCYQAEDVWKQIYIDQRVKFTNEEIYYNIDAINRAISENKKISFQYYHKIIFNQTVVPDEGKEFIVSPYALLWSNDKYYLAGNYQKYDDIANFRLDRINKVVILEESARSFSEVSPYPDYFDSADYLRKSFNMYNGEQALIELKCSNKILETILDKFGSDMEIGNCDSDSFTVRVRACYSDGLIEWLLQYGDRIIVQKPQTLRQEMLQRIEQLNAAYRIMKEKHDR